MSQDNSTTDILKEEQVVIPSTLSATVSVLSTTGCDYCVEVACETSDMLCGECSGQSCSSQCTSAECGECGTCQNSCQTTCQSTCQSCQTCESSEAPTSYGSITSTSTTSTSITITFTAISGATWYQVVYRKSSDTALTYINNGTSLTCTIPDLTENTEYVVNYRGAVSSSFGPYMPTGVTVTTTNQTFNWTYAGLNVSTGSPVTGTTKTSGLGLYVTAAEWNTLVGLVNTKKGTSISTVSSGQTITAAIVNKVATALGVSNVSSGTTIKASFFNSLRSAYNSL